ncbi:hypothetical protein ABIA30_004539 [Mycobacterium sp. MAA66]|uniref:LppA family lipoprotein n=1 Tax=Mycobacterium sp. MAA66 TaxID=3156297 RepID=UPI00351612B6
MNNPHEPTPPSVAAKSADELKSLPSLEDTKIAVQAAMDQITAAVSQLIPDARWETLSDGSGNTCDHPYEQSEGRSYFLPHVGAVRVPISEDQWASIQGIAKSAAAKLDATDFQAMKDQPGNHDVGFYGPAGLAVNVAYSGNLVVTGFTGCRLPADQK